MTSSSNISFSTALPASTQSSAAALRCRQTPTLQKMCQSSDSPLNRLQHEPICAQQAQTQSIIVMAVSSAPYAAPRLSVVLNVQMTMMQSAYST